jgi:predicted glycogen debranching enzyme
MKPMSEHSPQLSSGSGQPSAQSPFEPLRRIAWPVDPADPEVNATREWLVSNGLGGFASGTVPGVITRRYHGLLSAALPAPLGRIVMLSHVAEQLRWPDGRRVELGSRERSGPNRDALGHGFLTEFRLEAGLPVWRYDIEGIVLEKRLFLTHMQNTAHVIYELVAGADRIELALRPSVNFRAQESPVSVPLCWPYEFRAVEDRCEISCPNSGMPPLRLLLCGADARFTLKGKRIDNVLYPVEESRGYQAHGALWSPGYFKFAVSRGTPASLVASTETFETMTVLDSAQALEAERERRRRLIAQAQPGARQGIPAELVLAADQFIITPAGRTEEAARARASGDEVRTVIAGYHWFTDWGRDTMISLEGLTLATGRQTEAGYILRTFSHYVRDGLIPNMFPEGEKEGLYHTADATLWFFHAVARYVACSGDVFTLDALYPTLKGIIAAHVRGTQFGIGADPHDGLLAQGADGYQLTWMDAKVEGWVVTPRRGKAVEINALWYNALVLMEGWAGERNDPEASTYQAQAEQVERAFNQRFWNAEDGYLYDVVDAEAGGTDGRGNDARCRPNQILAVALPHPVLRREYWEPVVRTVEQRLLTPVGLRSLAPGDPEFKARYFGDLRARDAAYHQGTVWAWLVGPFVDAWLRVYPGDPEGARKALKGFAAHLDDACIGSISEIFDADAPFTPRGCIAQAWSVAEVLRSILKVNHAIGTPLATGGREGEPMAKTDDKIQQGILGDINPTTTEHIGKDTADTGDSGTGEAEESMVGGSQHDRTQHSGSRDVTDGTTVGTESGGTRNFRQGSGAVGVDIGNRPE